MGNQSMVVYTPPASSKAQLTIAEKKSAIVTRSQLTAIQQERIKAHFAHQAIQEIGTSRVEHFVEGAEAIWAIKDAPGRSPSLQGIIDDVAVGATLRMDSYLQKSTDIAAAHIIGVQGAATYEEPDMKLTGILRKRLRG